MGRACWWLTPLYDLVLSTVLSSPKLFADDTRLPVLDPGRGRTKTGRLWCYAVDDRPWGGPGHPAAAYVYSENRKGERPAGHLAGFRGVLQVDGYVGFKRLAGERADGLVRLAFCWAHMRRPFYEFFTATQSPLAAEVLARIRELYAIEAEIRGHPAEHRARVRHDRSRPIVDALHVWLQDQLGRVSAASDLAKAIRYAIRHWDGLGVVIGAIHWAGIARVHYANDRTTAAEAGFDDARLYREIALPVEDRALPMVQHLADEAKAAFDAWQARMSKAGPTVG